MTDSPILRLQNDLLEDSTPMSALLLRARVIAAKLNVSEAEEWMARELEGYGGRPSGDLPSYRRCRGVPKARDVYHGWDSIDCRNPKILELISSVTLAQPLAELEEIYERPDGELMWQLGPKQQEMLKDMLNERPIEVAIFFDRSILFGILQKIRRLVVDWTLELERADILGEGMVFSSTEKRDAASASHHYFIQNVGVFGSVTDNAVVTNTQKATAIADLSALASVVDEVERCLTLLPDLQRNEAEPIVAEVRSELGKEAPDNDKISGLFSSLKRVLEGATGSAAAQGIIALIGGLGI